MNQGMLQPQGARGSSAGPPNCGPSGCSQSQFPIRYGTGEIVLTVSDLNAAGFGFEFGFEFDEDEDDSEHPIHHTE